ncbi:hypothetical protein B0O99DRAFT_647474 [Bisporella sp. PMI_857]|nr:hypothetical protein B0O99DRAFT_647474 [Bisporella sp. PMI_857]
MATSLSRAFTTKRTTKSNDAETSMPQRSLTTKHPYGAIRSKKISAPVELISTTNMLSYNAPDIYPRSRSSTTSSTNSDGRSLSSSSTSPSSVGTPFTSPENSSVESSPTTALPEPNHLSCYFGTAPVPTAEEVPKIPVRAVSHTKKSAEYMARKRSISRMSSPKNSLQLSRASSSSKHSTTMSTARSSINMFNPDMVENPFGSELAQVSELVEEYGSSKETLPVVLPPVLPVIDEEERELLSRGLFKFRAEEYVSDLQGLFTTLFSDTHVPVPQLSAAWI